MAYLGSRTIFEDALMKKQSKGIISNVIVALIGAVFGGVLSNVIWDLPKFRFAIFLVTVIVLVSILVTALFIVFKKEKSNGTAQK